MPDTFETYIGLLEPYIPKALISGENLSKISGIARYLPANLSSFFGFECRLGDDIPEADFLVHLQNAENNHKALTDSEALIKTSIPETAIPAFEKVFRFCREWEKPETLLNEMTDHVWLEFDTSGNDCSRHSVPSFFFGISGKARSYIKEGKYSNEWVTKTAFPLILGGDLPEYFAGKITEAHSLLPDGAYIFQMGSMLSRQIGGVRVCIRDISPDDIPPYLIKLGYRGRPKELESLLSQLDKLVDRIDLDIDIISKDGFAEIGPKIGFECYFDYDAAIVQKYEKFHGFMEKQKLCTKDKSKALMEYIGYFNEWVDRDKWPKYLLAASSLVGHNNTSFIIRTLHHVKIVHQDDSPREAKAYLAVFHGWVPAKAGA